MPFAKGWTECRDSPAPPHETFMQAYQGPEKEKAMTAAREEILKAVEKACEARARSPYCRKIDDTSGSGGEETETVTLLAAK